MTASASLFALVTRKLMVKCVAQSKICLVSSLALGSLAHFASFVKHTIHLECALYCCLLVVQSTLNHCFI